MKKKVLIIGPNYFGYNESVEMAFIDLGWETVKIDYYDAFPNGFKNFLYYRLLPKLKVKYFIQKYQKHLNESILESVRKNKPSLILVVKGHKIEEETLKQLKKEYKLVLWMMDSVFRYKNTYENLRYYDYKFMFEETDVLRLELENIHSVFLPMAADSHNYFPIQEDRDIDVLFVGKLYPNRLELFERLINKFPHLNIKIYGKYTTLKNPITYFKYYFTNIKKYYTNEFVSPKELNKLYSRTKIAINIHHSQSQTGCNPRVFEILAAKTFQLVDEIPFIKENFSGDNLLASYSTEEELFNKIDFYITNPAERMQIAENGYKKIIENHTFQKRIEAILSVVEGKR